MKKYILILLLFTGFLQAQTLQNPTYGNTTTNTLKIKTPATVTSVNFLSTNDTDGSVSKIAPINVNIPYTPINYSAPTQTIGNHLLGIDTRLGALSSTSAGLTQRVWFTADNTTVTAGTFFASNPLNKGTTATGSPTALVLGDNVKAYFNKDLISGAQPATTIGYAGTYSGNLTVSATPTPNATQQRFTLEVYRCNNGGTPIASGVSGAPVGDLGVTVVAILDSGLVNLVAGSISNVSIQGTLTQNITINAGERLRYHVSAQKVGTGGGNVTFGVYYGSSYNSYYDVPVSITTDAVLNKVPGLGVTATDALNALDTGKISGIGSAGQVSFWNGTNTQTGDSGLFWDNVNKRLGIGNTLPTAAIDATASSTNTYTSFLTGILPPQDFGRISNSHNSGGTDQYASLILRVTGNLGANNALASISAIQPLAANGSSEMSLAVRSGAGQMFEAIRIGTATDVKINNLVGTGTRVVGVSSTGILTPLSADMVTGTGTANYISKWSATGVQSNSRAFDNGTNFVGINSIAPFVASIGQTFSIRSTGTDQGSALELIGTSGVDGTPTSRIIFGNTVSSSLPGAIISATRENGSSSYADLHFDVRGAGGYLSNAFRIASTGALSMSTTPTTSAGTYDILTRNTSTGVVEKILSSALPISGTYTPTYTSGTNVTSTTNSSATYTRVGNTITARVSFSCIFTAPNTTTTITFTLPVARATTALLNLGTGTGFTNVGGINSLQMFYSQSSSTTTADVKMYPTNGTQLTGTIVLMYNTTD